MQICTMKLNIGEIIQQLVKKKKISNVGFGNLINKERSNVYDIFKRETIDTGLLFNISKVLHTDLFKYYSDELKKELNILEEPIVEYKREEPKRRVMIEVSLSEQEYQELIKKRLL